MNVFIRMSRVVALLAVFLVAFEAFGLDKHSQTSIDEYVAQIDESYDWKVVDQRRDGEITTVTIELVSQTWLDNQKVNRTEWRHWLILSIPQTIRSNVGMLFIGGGSNRGSFPKEQNRQTATIANATQTIVAELKMVPNQPLIFQDDGVPRTEDDLIAYTWDQFLAGADPIWLARNAMVKSAVRAMDTVTEYTSSIDDGVSIVDKFVVTGASKRGWTSWITAAVDDRVVGLIPIVIDVLNVDKSMRHHFAAYGFWAPAIGDYVRHGIMQRLNDPKLAELYKIVDPYFYLSRLDMPKLMLNAAGDQFFLPDSSQFYYHDLIGPKFVRYIANTDHSMRDSDVLSTLIAFYDGVLSGLNFPTVSWTFPFANEVHVKTDIPPITAVLWTANNPTARDFRLETMGAMYKSTPIEINSRGGYLAKIPQPNEGWTAYFIELTYDIGAATPLKLTTEVKVIPETLPFVNKSPIKTPSITLVCNSLIELPTRKLAVEKKIHEKDLATKGLKTLVNSEDLYINWKSLLEFQSGFNVIRKILASENCSDPKIQLESGYEITLPPG